MKGWRYCSTILDLTTKWWKAVCFTLEEKAAVTHWTGGWVDLRTGLDARLRQATCVQPAGSLPAYNPFWHLSYHFPRDISQKGSPIDILYAFLISSIVNPNIFTSYFLSYFYPCEPHRSWIKFSRAAFSNNTEYYFTRSTLRLYYKVQPIEAVSGNNLRLF
jgi:hypothetical protein